MSPEQRVIKAMRDAQVILSDYLEPVFRNAEQTIAELLDVLDDNEVILALEDMEHRHEVIESPSTVPSGNGAPVHSVAAGPK
jgi:hypothetical protein